MYSAGFHRRGHNKEGEFSKKMDNQDHDKENQNDPLKMDPEQRDRIIVRTSMVGVAANVMLAVLKAVIGVAVHSIAITMDAVNNLSDAMSSVITIIGTKLASKAPDRKHPLGHGRAEYLTAAVISLLVLYAGITSLTESVKKILHPDVPSYTAVSLSIIAAAVVVKVVLGLYVRRKGNAVRSDSLVNSGADALLDAVISVSTLAAAAVYLCFHIRLEAWLGALIALVIIKAGIDMLRSTISQILGERADSTLSKTIKKIVASFDEVNGAYDLLLDNYGPDKIIGSIHIEVPDYLTACQIDELTRHIQDKVYRESGVIIATVGVYAFNTQDKEIVEMREHVREIVMRHEHVIQMHGFYVNKEEKSMRLDVIVDFTDPDAVAKYKHIQEDIQSDYPQYQVHVTLDYNVSD